jgi:hypothetical protein
MDGYSLEERNAGLTRAAREEEEDAAGCGRDVGDADRECKRAWRVTRVVQRDSEGGAGEPPEVGTGVG